MNRPANHLKTKYLHLAHQYRHWLRNTNLDTAVIITSLAGFVLSCFLTWSIIDHHKQQQNDLIDAYGNALNQIATNQLKVLMSSNNLIGLQSTLNDLINQTKVVNAIVYGVDNKIIVQAGDANRLLSISHKTYTSPITLDDALLGSLTINVDNDNTNNSWLTFILLVLIASLLLILLRKMTKLKLSATQTLYANETDDVDKIIQDKKTASDTLPTPNHQALLFLRFHTLNKLYQQLNAEARQKEFDKLQNAAQKVLTLYSGEQIAATPDTLVICFESKDKKDCLLNALYCAYLLLQTSKEQQWLMTFTSFIYDRDDCTTVEHLAQLKSFCQAQSEHLIAMKNKTTIENELNEHLTFSETSNCDYIHITGFSDSYEDLLKNQLKYILSNSD